ncbi:MAG: hypothetical protein KAR84_05545 [Elusimicrobiales bacterium]|nr:hypothetical protein [Elusimicrobiales bacterium]
MSDVNSTKMKPSEILNAVYNVLEEIKKKYSDIHPFVTAYQILEDLHIDVRGQLMKERGRAGKGSGVYYSAASVVTQAAAMLVKRGRVDMATINTTHLKVTTPYDEINEIIAGNPNVAIYRLSDSEQNY